MAVEGSRGDGVKKRAAESYPQVFVRTRAELRAWFAAHHATSAGAWVVCFKKGYGDPTTDPVDARVICEEALCVGWIDSLPRKLDAERTMLLVTPRRPASAWSQVNKDRVAALTAAGAMTPAGLAVVAQAKASGRWSALDAVEALSLPDDLLARFAREAPEARQRFDAFPRSARRGILEWINAAKRAETRARRIDETVLRAARNERANAWRP